VAAVSLRVYIFCRCLLVSVLTVVVLALAAAVGVPQVERAWLAVEMRHEADQVASSLAQGARPVLPGQGAYQLLPGGSCTQRIRFRRTGSALTGTGLFPVASGGRTGCLMLRQGLPLLTGARRAVAGWLVVGLVAAFGIALVLSWELAGTLARPLVRLSEGLARLARDLSAPALAERGPRELAELARAANRLASDLRRARAAQRTWISSAAHALKTPLTALQLVLAREAGGAEQEGQRALAQAEELIADLLAAETLAGRPPAERVDLERLTREVVDRRDGEIARRGLDLRLRLEPAEVSAPRGLLRHVLDGLLGNACKYTPPGGAIEVVVSRDGPRVCWVCADTGIGIPEGERERIGEPFFRASNARGVPGSGLGVSLAREFASTYGGRLALSQRAGGGTEAELVLPGAGSCHRTVTRLPRWCDGGVVENRTRTAGLDGRYVEEG